MSENKIATQLCGNCLTELPRKKRGRPQRYCSAACNKQAQRRARKSRSRPTGKADNSTDRQKASLKARNSPTKSMGQNPYFGSRIISVLGPRIPWGRKDVDPKVIERIRTLEIGAEWAKS